MAEHAFIEHLKEDHEKQKQLGEQLVAATDPAERDRLRKAFYKELYPHMMGEEASLFPRLKQADGGEDVFQAKEGLQEHHVARMVLRELMELNLDSDVFAAKAKVLDEINRHHIEEEEEESMARLVELCGKEELDSLFKKYEEAEEAAEQSIARPVG